MIHIRTSITEQETSKKESKKDVVVDDNNTYPGCVTISIGKDDQEMWAIVNAEELKTAVDICMRRCNK